MEHSRWLLGLLGVGYLQHCGCLLEASSGDVLVSGWLWRTREMISKVYCVFSLTKTENTVDGFRLAVSGQHCSCTEAWLVSLRWWNTKGDYWVLLRCLLAAKRFVVNTGSLWRLFLVRTKDVLETGSVCVNNGDNYLGLLRCLVDCSTVSGCLRSELEQIGEHLEVITDDVLESGLEILVAEIQSWFFSASQEPVRKSTVAGFLRSALEHCFWLMDVRTADVLEAGLVGRTLEKTVEG